MTTTRLCISQPALHQAEMLAAQWLARGHLGLTGTFLGQTTQLLAKHGARVYSIEPEQGLFAFARKLFSCHGNVEILNGTSEEVSPTLLPRISGDVNFWLDGQYSAGITFNGTQDKLIFN